MVYIIYCLLPKSIQEYHHDLVNKIHENFGLKITKDENLPSHFTLKYWFDTNNIEEVDRLLLDFCNSHKKTKINVSGFGSFPKHTIFINVELCKQAEQTFSELISKMKSLKWMPWDKYDGENIHFHSTIAEKCGDSFDDVWKFVQGKERHFECFLDNINVLELEKGQDGFVKKWKIHKKFLLG